VHGGFKQSERSADFPVGSNFGTLNGSEKFRSACFFHIAADWKVRLESPRSVLDSAVGAVNAVNSALT